MPAAATSVPRRGPRPAAELPKGVLVVPKGAVEKLVGAIGPSGACLCLLVIDQTTSKPRAPGSPAPEWCAPKLATLAGQLCMSEDGVRRLIDKAEKTGALEVRRADKADPKADGRQFELRFAAERLPSIQVTREPKHKRETPAQKPRKTVVAMPAQMACPVGQTCPVSEVYVNGRVTNFVPEGALVVRHDPENTSTGVEVSEDRPAENTSTPVEVSSIPAEPLDQPPPATGNVERFAEFWNGRLSGVLHKGADLAFIAERVLPALDGAPLEWLQAACLRKLRKLAEYGSGLLPKLAAEAATAHAAERQHTGGSPGEPAPECSSCSDTGIVGCHGRPTSQELRDHVQAGRACSCPHGQSAVEFVAGLYANTT